VEKSNALFENNSAGLINAVVQVIGKAKPAKA